MANNLWNNYTQKDTPVDNDELMIYDSEGKSNKRLLFGGFWKWIAKKLKEAELADLQTADKTIIGAINSLNGDSAFNKSKWQRIAITNGVAKIKNIYNREGVLLANISAYNTPSITEQQLYIIGFSSSTKNANFQKIIGVNQAILSASCDDSFIILNFTDKYTSALCRVLFMGY